MLNQVDTNKKEEYGLDGIQRLLIDKLFVWQTSANTERLQSKKTIKFVTILLCMEWTIQPRE